jgi:nucleoside-diphosphate kinase
MEKTERTFIAVKPDGLQRHLVGEIITRFEKRGMKLVAAKLISPQKEQVLEQYPDDENWYVSLGNRTLAGYKESGTTINMTAMEIGKMIREQLADYISDRPLLAMVWEGPHAIELGRKTVGHTNPLKADVGSIRGDYSMESYFLADDLKRAIQNLIHASGSSEEAEREIKIWFDENEILDYDLLTAEVTLGSNWGRVKKK